MLRPPEDRYTFIVRFIIGGVVGAFMGLYVWSELRRPLWPDYRDSWLVGFLLVVGGGLVIGLLSAFFPSDR